MKKKLVMMLLCGCLVLTGCGDGSEKENADATPTAEAEDNAGGGLLNNASGNNNSGDSTSSDTSNGAYWKPQGYVTLGKYLGVEVEKVDFEVTEEDIQEEIDYFLYYQSELVEITERNIAMGDDVVNIDYTLTVGGEEVGGDEGYDLELDGDDLEFADRLIGMHVGDTKEITMTIRDDYLYGDYVGQEGVYSVTINKIQEEVIPELTDELVAANTDYSTIEEYKQGIYEELYASKKDSAESEQIVNGFKKIMEESVFTGLSDADAQSYIDEMVSYYESYASMYGMDTETFIQLFTGSTYNEFLDLAKEQADYVVKQNLILAAVIAKENLELTDQEYTDGLSAYAADYGYDSPEEFEEYAGEAEVRDALLLDKAYDMIIDAMVINE